MIKLFLAFSNNLISKGIESLLASAEDIRTHTVDRGCHLDDAIRGEKPDVLLVDFCVLMNFLPDMTDKPKVLLLDTGIGSDNVNYAFISKNISGVMAVVLDEKTLLKAIRVVASGDIWIGRKEITHLVTFLSGLNKLRNLTKREMEILCLIGKGMNEDAISKLLVLNKKTVTSHIQKIRGKSGARNMCELAWMALHFSEYDKLQNYIEFINQAGTYDFRGKDLPSM